MQRSNQRRIERACRHCGATIDSAPYAHEPEGYCCERRLLDTRNQIAHPGPSDDAMVVLAEALTAALDARLFAVIDTMDAIASDRPCRKAFSFDAARAEIVRMAGARFDPIAADAFLSEEATLREMFATKCGEPFESASVVRDTSDSSTISQRK